MEPLFELDLTPISKGARDGAASLYRQLRAAILEGRLAPGSRLPPTRQASARFGVSRNTASEVYERLLHDGLVTSRHGSGTFVAHARPAGVVATLASAAVESTGAPAPDPRLNPFWSSEAAARSIGFWGEAEPVGARGTVIDLRPALIDPRLFPFDRLRQSFTRQLRNMENRPARLQGPHGNQGNYHLRRAIADHVALTRAVACRPEDVVVTSGAQQAFDLIARVLVQPGRTVAVEEPGYPPMRAPFAAAGAVIRPVPCDEEGLRVDLLAQDTQVVCATPSHQFPLGVAMSAARRRDLLDFARQSGAVIVEDDYDSEFRYEGSPLTALRTADAADVVFYVGTFSKTMLPSLRLGFVIAPAWARRALVAAKNATDWHASSPLQQGVAGFMNEGHLARHVLRMRQLYAARRDALLEAVATILPADMRVMPSPGGMHVTLVTQADRDMEAVSRQLAAQHQLQAHGLARYFAAEPSLQGLVLGFGTADAAQLAQGVEAIGQVLQAR